MKAKARYPLNEVFDLIANGKYWFSAEPRSIFAVMEVYEKAGSPKTLTEARDFILGGVRGLTEADFCESIIQWGDSKCIADVYGIIYEKRPWYVKFRVDEDREIEEISFHPPEKDLKTTSGTVIPGTGRLYGKGTEKK